MKFFRFRIVHDGEKIAAGTAVDGLHQAERNVGGDGRIHRGAAGLEYVQANLRGERMTGANHPVLRDDLRARRECASGDPIDLRVASPAGAEAEAEKVNE